MLADPVLELHGPSGFTTITNNNWRDTQEAEIQATGIPPTNDLESAIVATLAPGAYTAIVRGNGNTPGVALVEVYDLNQAADSKLANLSTRAFVSTGDNIVIAGFMLGNDSGDWTESSCAASGRAWRLWSARAPCWPIQPWSCATAMERCSISNNDWQDNPAQAAEIIAAGLAPSNDLGVGHSGDAAAGPLHRAAGGTEQRHRHRRWWKSTTAGAGGTGADRRPRDAIADTDPGTPIAPRTPSPGVAPTERRHRHRRRQRQQQWRRVPSASGAVQGELRCSDGAGVCPLDGRRHW